MNPTTSAPLTGTLDQLNSLPVANKPAQQPDIQGKMRSGEKVQAIDSENLQTHLDKGKAQQIHASKPEAITLNLDPTQYFDAIKYLKKIKNEFDTTEIPNVSECIKYFYFTDSPDKGLKENSLRETDQSAVAQGMWCGFPCDAPPFRDDKSEEVDGKDNIDQFLSRLVKTDLLGREDYESADKDPRLFANKTVTPIAPTLYFDLTGEVPKSGSDQTEQARPLLMPIDISEWQDNPAYKAYLEDKLEITHRNYHEDGSHDTTTPSSKLLASQIYSYAGSEDKFYHGLSMLGKEADNSVLMMQAGISGQLPPKGFCHLETAKNWETFLNNLSLDTDKANEILLNCTLTCRKKDWDWLAEPLNKSNIDEFKKRLLSFLPK